MCGRFGVTDPSKLGARLLAPALRLAPRVAEERLSALDREAPGIAAPRYNIAPSRPVLAVLERRKDGIAARRLTVLQWGLVPSWADDPAIGHRLANARAETVAVKPAFRGAWGAGRRCLVPADVFYEWADVADPTDDPRNGDAPGTPATPGARRVARAPRPVRQPYAFRMTGNEPFCFAGLWEAWRPPAGPEAADSDDTSEASAAEGAASRDARPWLVTCTLITTAPNRLMGGIHDRMPVIVPPEQYDRWLDRETAPADAAALLAPYPDAAMRAYAVSTWVNAPVHDDPGVLEPLAGAPTAADDPPDMGGAADGFAPSGSVRAR